MTTSLLMLWLVPLAVAGIGMALMTWWDIRHPKTREDGIIKLSDILLGVFLAVCPLVNIVVAFGMVVYFMTQIAPNIVVIGRKP